MHRVSLITASIMLFGVFILFQYASALNPSDRLSEIIQERLTFSPKQTTLLCRKDLLCGPNVLLRFYAARSFQPAWNGETGVSPAGAVLVREIRATAREGLRPADYHLANIENLLAELTNGVETNGVAELEMRADLDILLTDAFLLYGSHLLTGHVNPETIKSQWAIESRDADLGEILTTALDRNEIEKALDGLRPQHAAYASLKEALRYYHNIMETGAWPKVASGPKMERGDWGSRVRALRSRLAISGDLVLTDAGDPYLFDDLLDLAVRGFQERHGLEVDGIVGRETLKVLNVTVTERLHQIRANLERWRWVPHSLGSHYILVNIANFELDVVEHGQTVMSMRVVVGKGYRRTPVFTGSMTYMELNPYWHIPPRIAVRDIVPNVRQDPQYLTRKNIRVLESWDPQASEVDPGSIDWTRITSKSFPFKLRQEPGPDNALGRVKFMFPNKFNVYLHDTPARTLFQRTKRTFSSGCIRVEKPIDLAVYLLRGNPDWTRARIVASIESGKTQTVHLPEPIPVHLLYWTAWVDSGGTIHFRDDIYGRDKRLIEALNEGPPTP